jgi:hypothetical protein
MEETHTSCVICISKTMCGLRQRLDDGSCTVSVEGAVVFIVVDVEMAELNVTC